MLPWNDSSISHMGLSAGLKLVNGTGEPTEEGIVPGVVSLAM